jgi:hypothetical protein
VGSLTVTKILTPGPASPTNVLFPFAVFAGVDFSRINNVTLTIGSNAGLFSLNSFDTVPEPSTAPLLGLGLARPAASGRRRSGCAATIKSAKQ